MRPCLDAEMQNSTAGFTGQAVGVLPPRVNNALSARRKELMMSYSLNVEPKSGYLYITVTGENSYNNVVGYLAKVRDMCLKFECSNVLIVENLAGPSLDTLRIYDLISKASEKTTQVVLKIAYVDINPKHDDTAMRFAENVAVNRGVVVRVFSTIRAAEQWLIGQEAPGGNG
jgi:hypothetical protein